MKDKENQLHEDAEKEARESRRDFLKKAGAFAIYTPPAITMLMHPSHASITKSPGGTQQSYEETYEDKNHTTSRWGSRRH